MATPSSSILSDVIKILGAVMLVFIGFKFMIAMSKLFFYALLLLGAWLAFESISNLLAKDDDVS